MTVASGPEPNAGSRPNRPSVWGNAIATTVAIEQLIAEGDRSRRGDVGLVPHREGEAKNADPRSTPMTSPVSSSRAKMLRTETQRHPANDDGLGLRTHGVGHVDDRRQEERKENLLLDLVLERSDHDRGRHRSEKPETEPGQSMPQSSGDRASSEAARASDTPRSGRRDEPDPPRARPRGPAVASEVRTEAVPRRRRRRRCGRRCARLREERLPRGRGPR